MRRLLIFVAVFLFLSQLSIAKGIGCPKNTTPNGEKTPEGSEAWCEDRNQQMHGPYRAWWPNGILGTKGQYEHGIATGKWLGWYPNGKIQGEELFKNGGKIKAQYFDKQGRQISKP
jgi:antitoxin component YwqK of YwqJK toxin-antitoxin module